MLLCHATSLFPRAAVAAAAAAPPANKKLVVRVCTCGSDLWRRGLSSRSSPPTSAASPSSSLVSAIVPFPDGFCRRPSPRHTPSTPRHQVGRMRRPLPSTSFFSSSVPRIGTATTTALTMATRAMSSYEWKNMSKQAQKANKEFSDLTKKEVRKAGEDEIDKVEKAVKAMEPFNDVFEVRRDGLELFVELGPEVGTYWIKFDLTIHQICLVSPRSGPHRYIYDKESGRWIGEADKHDFQGMLTGDIIQSACGIPDF